MRQPLERRRYVASFALATLLGACGGGDGGGGGASVPPPAPSAWVAGTFLPTATFAARCAVPRSGIDPSTAQPYRDAQGTVLTENNWLRSWSNDLYLWYDEIVDRDPALHGTAEYFALLKTDAVTPSGRSKDRYHFTYPTAEWRALTQSGISVSYGAAWAVRSSEPPRDIIVAYTEPHSPATAPGVSLERGERVTAVDGIDVVQSSEPLATAAIAALFPAAAGESHAITLRHPLTLTERTVVLTAERVMSTPVQHVKVVETAGGPVGYLLFNDHIATAEQALVSAVDALRTAAITDLVLDVRYNGGGILAIASQLAYMIAGTVPTAGQTFERLSFNAKHAAINPVTGEALAPMPFFATTRGYATIPGQPLPTLNLPRVYVLTGATTCSASESIINALRGVNVEVLQIGATTCGKPYGFYPTDNCGTTYFTVQFKGVNAAGFGDYTDGFSPSNMPGPGGIPVPGCAVADDFGHVLGDVREARFAAALEHRLTGSCPASPALPLTSAVAKTSGAKPAAGREPIVRKSPALENRLMDGS